MCFIFGRVVGSGWWVVYGEVMICALLFGGWVRCDHGGEVEIK